MKCTACGQECFDEAYPQMVFQDDKKCICEECSIDFEEVNGVVQFRQDLVEDGCVESTYQDKKKIEFKNVEKIDESVFKTISSIDINKALQNGEIVFTTRHPEGVKRAERVSSIPKIEIDEEKVKEIADQINHELKGGRLNE